MKEYVEAQVHAGHFSTPSEYLRMLIREDRARKANDKPDNMVKDGDSAGKSNEKERKTLAQQHILRDKREQILEIASRHGARRVRLIGSVARGEARPDSDVDFLVEMDPGRSLLDHAALMIELEKALGRKVDVATEKGMRPAIRERVLQDAIPL